MKNNTWQDEQRVIMERLHKELVKKHKNQNYLAYLLGVSPSAVSKYFNTESRISLKSIILIGKKMGIDLNYILYGDFEQANRNSIAFHMTELKNSIRHSANLVEKIEKQIHE